MNDTPSGAPLAYSIKEARLIHWVCRFDKADGSKEILPQTLWREGGRLGWRWGAPPVPRPLYGLDRLALALAAPVLIVEGEKTADAAAGLFPGFAVASWSGGSKAVGKADWAALAGRRVAILPDGDTPGREAAQAVHKAALAAGAEGAAIVQLPASLPAAWDCADPFPPGFAQSDLLRLIGAALDAASTGRLEMPPGYTLDDDGLYWLEPGKDGADARAVRLSDPFDIMGEARDGEGGDWGLLIRFRDRDGLEKRKTVKRAALASDAGAVRAELAGAGMLILSATGQSDRFIRFLRAVTHSARLTLAERTGWVDASRFILPHAIIAPPGAEPVHFDGAASALHYREKGSLDGWRRALAALAPGNSLLTFAVSLAFVGPIMRWLDMEGGGFHFRGASSTGKTSLALAAGSVWGGGGSLGFASSWRATGNALEGVAHGHTETLLILDELALVDPQEAGNAAYALASGQGKARAGQTGALRRRAEWRVMVCSTGEIGLADHMRAAKRSERTMAGQELRLLDLPADAGAGFGAWEGEVVSTDEEVAESPVDSPDAGDGTTTLPPDEPEALPRKLYVDGGEVEVVAHLVYDLDSDGKRLTCRKLTDWTGEKVRTLFPTPAAFRAEWAIPDKRGAIIDALAERGIDLVALQVDAGRPDDDPFDLLCHLAWNAPLTTRSERAQRLRAKEPDLFQRYGDEARRVIDALLEKYAATGPDQLSLPQALKVQPISDFGNPSEIARLFGGPQAMREAVAELTEALYAA